jgi:hypothetical protein
MAEALNAADHLTRDTGAYPTCVPMPSQTGVQKIMMNNLEYEHVTNTFFFNNC